MSTKIDENLNSKELIRKHLDALCLRPATDIEMVGFDERDPTGWMIGCLDTPRGLNVIVIKGNDAFGLVYMDGSAFREHYNLSRHWQSPEGKAVEEVAEDDLDDTDFGAVTKGLGDNTTLVEMDQFYHPDGFLKLECSDELPAAKMAEALLAAWKILRDDADRKVGLIDPSRAYA